MEESEYPDTHPPAVREGLIERAVKGIGKGVGTLMPGDMIYLEQYLHPEVDILPRTALKPTIAGTEGMVVRGAAPNSPATGYQGLGGYNTNFRPDVPGGAWPRGTEEIEDVWDFNTDSELLRLPYLGWADPYVEGAAKAVMRRVGTPYAVRADYRAGDIELPKK